MRTAGIALSGGLVAGFVPTPLFAQAGPSPERKRVAMAVGGQAAMIYLPLTIAERLGYFKDAGLDVEISDFSAGSKALQAVVGGSADVVTGVYEHTIRMQATGQHLQAFVVMGNSMQLAFAVATKEVEHVKTLQDLKGRKIGVAAPGSTTHMMVERILAGAGLTGADVSIVGVGLSGSAVSAIVSGQVDAICTAEASATLMERRGLIKVMVDARTQSGTEQVFGGPVPTAVLYAQSAFVRDYPNTAQALTGAIIRAGRWLLHATPDELAKTVPESYLAGERAAYLEAFEKVRDGFSGTGLVSPTGPQHMVAALAAFDPKIVPAQIDLTQTYTNQFASTYDKSAA